MKLKIDLNKPEEVRQGLNILLGLTTKVKTNNSEEEQGAVKQIVAKSEQTEQIEQTEQTEQEKQSSSMVTNAEETTNEKLTVENLRAKTQILIEKGFKDEVRQKLKGELKVNSVSSLKEDKWEEFNKFLDTLVKKS